MQMVWQMFKYLNKTVSINDKLPHPSASARTHTYWRWIVEAFDPFLQQHWHPFTYYTVLRWYDAIRNRVPCPKSCCTGRLYLNTGHILTPRKILFDVKFLCMWNQSGNKFENNLNCTLHDIRNIRYWNPSPRKKNMTIKNSILTEKKNVKIVKPNIFDEMFTVFRYEHSRDREQNFKHFIQKRFSKLHIRTVTIQSTANFSSILYCCIFVMAIQAAINHIRIYISIIIYIRMEVVGCRKCIIASYLI